MIPFSQFDDFVTFCGDSIEVGRIINGTVDMIFADPPYFLSKGKTICIGGTYKKFDLTT